MTGADETPSEPSQQADASQIEARASHAKRFSIASRLGIRYAVLTGGIAVLASATVLAFISNGQPISLHHSTEGGAVSLGSHTPKPASELKPMTDTSSYQQVSEVPNPIPGTGVVIKGDGMILTPFTANSSLVEPHAVSITQSQAESKASQYFSSSAMSLAEEADLTDPGSNTSMAQTSSLDGVTVYVQVINLPVWLVVFKMPQPFCPYLGSTPNAECTDTGGPAPLVNTYVVALDAITGNFVRGFYY